jgi:hypothetical protein
VLKQGGARHVDRAACHKSVAPPALNGYKFIRGFSVYDEWQQSGASREVVSPFYRKEKQIDCRACHMSVVASTNDKAVKNGLLVSHRWLGANTITPLFAEVKNGPNARLKPNQQTAYPP